MGNNEPLERLLDSSEVIKWEGKPEKFRLLDSSNKKKLILRWTITAVIAMICLIGYPLLIAGSSVKFTIWLPVIIVVIALYFFLRPLVDAKALMNRRYVITNKRVAVINKDGEIKDMLLERISDVALIDKKDGTGDIAIGKEAVTAKNSKLRQIALVPREDIYAEEGQKISGMVFYNVKEFKVVRDYFMPGTEIHERNL